MEATVHQLPVPERSTIAAVVAKIEEAKKQNLSADEWSMFWPKLVYNAHLDPVGEAKVIEALDEILGVGKRALTQTLKGYREGQRAVTGGAPGARPDKYTTLVKLLREDRKLLAALPQFNQVSQSVELVTPSGSAVSLEDVHVSKLREELGKLGTGFSFGKDDVWDALKQIGQMEHSYHPVQQYLNGLTWDGIPRLNDVAKEYLGAEDDLSAMLLRKWFISAVARALKPGEKVDTVLILVGEQGIRKSTFFKTLGGEWFSDTSLDLHNKDSFGALRGAWIYEWPELETVQRARSQNLVKAFLSSTEDYYRPPYGRTLIRVPRSCVIVGTTNDSQFLTDPTGNRRYHPVEVTVDQIDQSKLAANREQLWAEAVVAYKNDEQWWLNEAEGLLLAEAQSKHVVEHPWTEAVRKYVHGGTDAYVEVNGALMPKHNPDGSRAKTPKLDFVTTAELLTHALRKPLGHQHKTDEQTMGGVMRGLGWEHKRRMQDKVQEWGWARPGTTT